MKKNNNEIVENNSKTLGFNYVEKLIRKSLQLYEVDKVKIFLDDETYAVNKDRQYIPNHHINIVIQKGVPYLEITGKIVSNSHYLGGIRRNNLYKAYEEIKKDGIIITADTLLNSRITAIDVKRDVVLPSHIDLHKAISILREMAYQSTKKHEIITYRKDCGRKNSIVIRRNAETIVDTLSVYCKFNEIFKKRKNDNGYYDIFSADYLEQVKHILRFERRIHHSVTLRNAFHLNKKETVTLQKVFDCPFNVVGEAVFEIFGISGGINNES